jgi:drug/metabolite transporter (DMT)-like permease
MADDVPHAAESVTAVAGEGGVAVSYVAPGTRVSPKAVVLLTVSALIFSTGGLFIRELDDPQAWRTVFWRSLGACFSLALLIVWRERTDPFRAVIRIGRPGWAVGAAFSASSIGMVVALTKTSVAIVLVIFALSPLAAAVMARIIIGERIRGYTWIAIGTTVAGVAFMVSGPGAGGSAAGALIALIIPIAFGFGTVMIRRHSEIAMAPAMLLSAGFSCLISVPFAHPFDISTHDLVLLLTFGFAQLGIGLAVFSIGAAHAPATDVALLSMIEPIVGPIWVWIFVAEYPGVPALIGGSIVFVALAVHTLYAASRATDQPLSTGLTVTPGATTSSTAATTS